MGQERHHTKTNIPDRTVEETNVHLDTEGPFAPQALLVVILDLGCKIREADSRVFEVHFWTSFGAPFVGKGLRNVPKSGYGFRCESLFGALLLGLVRF